MNFWSLILDFFLFWVAHFIIHIKNYREITISVKPTMGFMCQVSENVTPPGNLPFCSIVTGVIEKER